jgi:hypothetical protein
MDALMKYIRWNITYSLTEKETDCLPLGCSSSSCKKRHVRSTKVEQNVEVQITKTWPRNLNIGSGLQGKGYRLSSTPETWIGRTLVTNSVTVNLWKKFFICTVKVHMIYIHTRFHMPNSHTSLDIAITSKAKYTFSRNHHFAVTEATKILPQQNETCIFLENCT